METDERSIIEEVLRLVEDALPLPVLHALPLQRFLQELPPHRLGHALLPAGESLIHASPEDSKSAARNRIGHEREVIPSYHPTYKLIYQHLYHKLIHETILFLETY